MCVCGSTLGLEDSDGDFHLSAAALVLLSITGDSGAGDLEDGGGNSIEGHTNDIKQKPANLRVFAILFIDLIPGGLTDNRDFVGIAAIRFVDKVQPHRDANA